MRNILVPMALIAAILTIPIVPFLVLGESFESQM